jgi:hypothetical protein
LPRDQTKDMMTGAEGPAPDPLPSEREVLKKLRSNSFTIDMKIAKKINEGKWSGDPDVIAVYLKDDFLYNLYLRQGGRCKYTDIALDIRKVLRAAPDREPPTPGLDQAARARQPCAHLRGSQRDGPHGGLRPGGQGPVGHGSWCGRSPSARPPRSLAALASSGWVLRRRLDALLQGGRRAAHRSGWCAQPACAKHVSATRLAARP